MTRDRDVRIPKERAAPSVEISDEVTGKHDGDELRELRRKRPTDERIERLEDKHDSLVRVVGDFRADMGSKVGEMSGKLDAVLEHVTAAHREQNATERVRISSRGKMIVGIVGAICTALGAVIASMAGCA